MARRGRSVARSGSVVDVTVVGGRQLQRKMATLERKIQRKIIRKALRAAAKQHVKPAVDAELAKVSPGEFGTGRLRTLGSKVRALKTRGRGRRRRFGVQVQLPTRDQLDIKPDHAYYPAILEFGNVRLNIRPRRMLLTAREKAGGRSDATIARELKKGVDAAVTRLGRIRARLGV